MIGTRVNGIVAAELKDVQGGPAGSGGRWSKILGLAGKVSGWGIVPGSKSDAYPFNMIQVV
jgi:hypothetical protein